MNTPSMIIAALALSCSPLLAPAGEITSIIGEVPGSSTLVLAKGESAKLHYSGRLPDGDSADVTLNLQMADRSVTVNRYVLTNFAISGPATITVQPSTVAGALTVATFDVTRVGTASQPACIPQEAGSTFNVILESSSDLVNWTPANPGAYPGLETKRFFRTRIVKQ